MSGSLDLEAIKKELAATTPGEWRVILPGSIDDGVRYPGENYAPGSSDCGGIVTDKAIVCRYGDSERYYPTEGTPMDSADYAFVINAHNRHIPALIAEIESLRDELERHKRAAQMLPLSASDDYYDSL